MTAPDVFTDAWFNTYWEINMHLLLLMWLLSLDSTPSQHVNYNLKITANSLSISSLRKKRCVITIKFVCMATTASILAFDSLSIFRSNFMYLNVYQCEFTQLAFVKSLCQARCLIIEDEMRSGL